MVQRATLDSGLVACLDLAQELPLWVQHSLPCLIYIAGNHEEYEKHLINMANTLAPYLSPLVTEDVGGSVARIME